MADRVNVVTLPATTATLAHTIPLSVLGMDYAPPEDAIGQPLLLRRDGLTPRQRWGTCCPNDPECEHSYLDADALSRWMDTPDDVEVEASCTLAAVVPIIAPHEDAPTEGAWLFLGESMALIMRPGGPRDVTPQRPYSDFSPTGPCPTCGGSGIAVPYATSGPACERCEGGRVQRYAWLIEDVEATTERCPRCWGYGTFCPTCQGTHSCPPVPMPGHPGELTEANW
jgi:hypothetical protein